MSLLSGMNNLSVSTSSAEGSQSPPANSSSEKIKGPLSPSSISRVNSSKVTKDIRCYVKKTPLQESHFCKTNLMNRGESQNRYNFETNRIVPNQFSRAEGQMEYLRPEIEEKFDEIITINALKYTNPHDVEYHNFSELYDSIIREGNKEYHNNISHEFYVQAVREALDYATGKKTILKKSSETVSGPPALVAKTDSFSKSMSVGYPYAETISTPAKASALATADFSKPISAGSPFELTDIRFKSKSSIGQNGPGTFLCLFKVEGAFNIQDISKAILSQKSPAFLEEKTSHLLLRFSRWNNQGASSPPFSCTGICDPFQIGKQTYQVRFIRTEVGKFEKQGNKWSFELNDAKNVSDSLKNKKKLIEQLLENKNFFIEQFLEKYAIDAAFEPVN